MFKDSFLKKINTEHASELLQERQERIDKARRALPRIAWKRITHPNWKATCPKSGCELTLAIIKDELMAYLEEAEGEIDQLEKHLKISEPRTNMSEAKQLELNI